MQVQRIQSYTYNTPSFKSYSDFTYKSTEMGHTLSNIVNSSVTWFLRGAPTVEKRMDVLMKEFGHLPKINMYDFGCSDCSDMLSLIMGLHSKYGAEVLKKISPVVCYDKNGAPIYRAEQGIYTLSPGEIIGIEVITSGNFDKYFFSTYGDKHTTGKWNINSLIRSCIKADVGDVMEKYKKIEPYNSYVQARNFWSYLSEEEKEILAKNLHNQMQGNSLLVIGETDKEDIFDKRPAEKFLIDAGFVQHPDSEYIYRVK